jgi:hypothetical protein
MRAIDCGGSAWSIRDQAFGAFEHVIAAAAALATMRSYDSHLSVAAKRHELRRRCSASLRDVRAYRIGRSVLYTERCA